MARQALSANKLAKMQGMDTVLANLSAYMSPWTGKELKKVFRTAALPIEQAAHRNIDGMDISPQAKEILKETVIIPYGEDRFPNVFAKLSQVAAQKKARQRGIRWPNPYWFELGTVLRFHKSGHRTGKMFRSRKGQPFFRPAITASKERVIAGLIKGLKDVHDRAISKFSKSAA